MNAPSTGKADCASAANPSSSSLGIFKPLARGPPSEEATGFPSTRHNAPRSKEDGMLDEEQSVRKQDPSEPTPTNNSSSNRGCAIRSAGAKRPAAEDKAFVRRPIAATTQRVATLAAHGTMAKQRLGAGVRSRPCGKQLRHEPLGSVPQR